MSGPLCQVLVSYEILRFKYLLTLVLIKAGKMPVVYHCGAN